MTFSLGIFKKYAAITPARVIRTQDQTNIPVYFGFITLLPI
jgi:hypothetical protein